MSTQRLQPVASYLARETAVLLGAEGCIIWLQDRNNPDYLICEAIYHTWLDQLPVGNRLKSGEGIAGEVFQTGKTLALAGTAVDLHTTPNANVLGSGTVRCLLAVPIMSDGSPIGVIELVNKRDCVFDEDDQKLAEALAAAAAATICSARLVKSLQRQVNDLQVRNDDLDAFAHSVAHDLQNPLSQIVGFAQLLEFKLEMLSDDERKYVVNALTSSANKMSSIIQELLLLASVRKTDVTAETLQMEAIVANALRRLEHLISKANAELILPETWPTVLGYAPWVEEVWENYLSNAVKYGGDPPRIELGSAEEPYGMARFWVRDNGAGFDADVKAKLFAPFSRPREGMQNHPRNGHGLGLSIVRRIVEKLGGKVEAECIAGEGTVFSFTLPVVKD